MKVTDCIFFQLNKAGRTSAGYWAKQVEHLGVTPAQAMVLNFLGEEDRIPSHILGQKLQLTSATMTGILDRLEKLDLIERLPHPEDRRAILICLTESGRKYAREINALMVQANRSFLSGLSPEEAGTLRGLLGRLEINRELEE